MSKPIHNLKILESSRKSLRNNSTSAEAVLWTFLKGKQLEGRKFRRQHSIENYIVDFYCSEEKLVIELDGEGHYKVGGQVHDQYRDKRLEAFGYKVLHFENKLVFKNIEGLLEEIKGQFACRRTPPSCRLSPTRPLLEEEGGEK